MAVGGHTQRPDCAGRFPTDPWNFFDTENGKKENAWNMCYAFLLFPGEGEEKVTPKDLRGLWIFPTPAPLLTEGKKRKYDNNNHNHNNKVRKGRERERKKYTEKGFHTCAPASDSHLPQEEEESFHIHIVMSAAFALLCGGCCWERKARRNKKIKKIRKRRSQTGISYRGFSLFSFGCNLFFPTIL